MPERLIIWAKPSSCLGTQRELITVAAGRLVASHAPTRKRSPSIKRKACRPSGVSRVNSDQPTQEQASRNLGHQESTSSLPGIPQRVNENLLSMLTKLWSWRLGVRGCFAEDDRVADDLDRSPGRMVVVDDVVVGE